MADDWSMQGHNQGPALDDESEVTLDVSNAIQAWAEAAGNLSVADKIESDLRWSVAKLVFPEPHMGTNRVRLGQGFSFKLNFQYNYRLDKNRLPDVIAKIYAMPGGQEAVEACIRYRPELVPTAYNALPEGPIKEALRSVVTTTVAKPALELVTPNTKKE